MNFQSYRTYCFDCDGVLFDSNEIKSRAFYDVALPYGEDIAKLFLERHKARGGVSRFQKFEELFRDILELTEYQDRLETALAIYSETVYQQMLVVPETESMRDLIASLAPDSNKYIVSGGLGEELIRVFAARGLDIWFTDIFGSPTPKMKIMEALVSGPDFARPAVFIGDSKLDYEVSQHFDLDFVFVSAYTEFKQWRDYFADKSVYRFIDTLTELLPAGSK